MRDDGIMPSVANSADGDADDASLDDDAQPAHPLDSAQSRTRLSRLRDWYDQEWDRQAFNRYQQALDEDYYDSLQWTEEDASALMERGQAPAVYNEIKSTIDWMIGTERRTRIDYKVLPRRKEASDDAEIKTKLLKYLSDTNKEPMARSEAFASACKAGVGWLEVGVRGDQTDEPIYYRAQPWRQMLYDSNATELDLSDARYVFRWKYLDVDVARAYFPGRQDVITRSARDGTRTGQDDEDEVWYLGARVTAPGQDFAGVSAGKYRPYDGSAFAFSRRDRVKLVECWYRDPTPVKVMRGGQFDGQPFDGSPEHQQHVELGLCSVFDRVEMSVRCAIYGEAGLLFDGASPYRHNRFPFIPVWAYRRRRDHAPYSPIRTMRDAQDSLNKRASKALWILSTNQIELEEGAVDDIEVLRDEAARPDAIIVRKRGKELTINRDNALAEEHLRLMERDQQAIRASGGVTNENLGRETNANSGKAIIARQDQGGVITTELLDNLRFAIQQAGEIELSLIEQFFTQQKTVRLVGERGGAKFVDINAVDPQTGETLNDITREQADFVVAQQDYRDAMRQAMYESLFDIVSRLAQMNPEIALKLLDLVVDLADVPNRDELVARIRQLNGMRDPDSEPSPEEQQAMQQQAQAQSQEQAMQKALVIARAKAELAELEARQDKLTAEAVEKRLAAMRSALDSAQMVAMAPALGAVADDLMQGAGYADQSPKAKVTTQQQARQALAAQQQMAAEDQQAQPPMAPPPQPMTTMPPAGEPSGLPSLPGAVPP